ncbi:MAG: hypothetical protein M0P11_03300 [Anaerolineaceae bacterium]|jgi:hypothetical protein|nr:hypothetical protein [Anaerolineaceae bacterium]
MNDEKLAKKYQEILRGIDINFLNSNKPKKLSGVFLPSVPDTYIEAKNKIMIVGRETRAWPVLKENEDFPGLDKYIQKTMAQHKKYFVKTISENKGRGNSFFNFVRDIKEVSGVEGLVWTNLLSFSWNNGNPLNAPCFDMVKEYSRRLLHAQIEFFRPSLIIFANGSSTTRIRREFFPVDGKVCTNGYDFSQAGVEKHQLWAFTLYNNIQCYRIHHPSHWAKKSVAARQYLLTQLPKRSNR